MKLKELWRWRLMKLWLSIKERSDFEDNRNRRRERTGNKERMSVSSSDGIFAIWVFWMEMKWNGMDEVWVLVGD